MNKEPSLSENYIYNSLYQFFCKYVDLAKKEEDKFIADTLERGIVFSTVKPKEILVTGINPSFRKGEENLKSFSYDYESNSLGKDFYYSSIAKMLGELNDKATYLDLFCCRETSQSRFIKTFLNNELGVSFLAEHLAFTQELIENIILPKLIIVKNKGSWFFWGKDAKQNPNWTNVWMGYDLELIEKVPSGEICRVKGLIEDNQRVNNSIIQTNLIDTIILFTNHFQYCKKENKPDDGLIERLYKMKQNS